MTISRKLHKPDHPKLNMENLTVTEVSTHKHLGLHISNDGTWHKHIDVITEKAYKRLNVLRKFKFILDRRSLDIIYLTYIRPLLEYADFIWDINTHLLIDVQKNQSNIEFQYRHEAIEKFLKVLNNDGSNKRVGMVAYSDHADYVFKLSWLNDVDKLIGDANNVDLDKVPIESNLSHTLQFVGVDAFSNSNGRRTSSRKIVMMFSSLTSDNSVEIRN
ncbi:unnamed protein product [Mytilus coruscus]|uniref:VWFA domain-containing protein n=1 Tax=Mytilus coruscus TaxID=42192 RepID=A0A6J8CG41_MYTCO|nr:unnamed protein product [Mytilus coruscus]